MLIPSRRAQLVRLLAGGRIRACDLAQQLEVSQRTVYREVQRLRRAGYRIGSAPGPRGGFWLAPDSTPAPVDLPVAQLRRLLLHLQATQGPPPIAESLKRALPPHVRTRTQSLLDAVTPDPWSRADHTSDAVLERVEVAIDARWPLKLDHQIALPERLRRSGCSWLLQGVLQHGGHTHRFELDQVASVTFTGQPWLRRPCVTTRYRYRRPDDPPRTERHGGWSGPSHTAVGCVT